MSFYGTHSKGVGAYRGVYVHITRATVKLSTVYFPI